MTTKLSIYRRRQQRGAALVISLLLLSLLTVLALSASQTTRLQERMAGNARDLDVAFQSAEAGVRNAEDYIETLPDGEPAVCTAAPCHVFQVEILPADMGSADDAWWTTNGWEYGTATKEMLGVVADPNYVIEYSACIPDDLLATSTCTKRYFRTIAAGKGATDSAKVVLQTTYTKRL